MDELVQAVTSEDLKGLSQRLSSAPHLVNVPIDDERTTLLHLAANSTKPAILQLLLGHGAEPNWQDDDGLCALHVAAMWGNEVAVKLLMDSGADPVILDGEDMTPLDHALSEGHNACAELLQTASGLECSMVALEGEGAWQEGAEVNMSMAETFVSMFADDLTQVTELSPDQLDSPCKTPLTSNGTSHVDSPYKIPGAPLTSNGAPHVDSPYKTPGAPLTSNGTPHVDKPPGTPISSRATHELYDSPNLTPTNPATPISLNDTPTNESVMQQHTTGKGGTDIPKNPRRELFPEVTAELKENDGLSMLYTTADDAAYFEDTIIIESFAMPRKASPKEPHSASVDMLCREVSSTHVSCPPAASRVHLAEISMNISRVSTVSGRDNSVMDPMSIPPPSWILKLSNGELRDKLVSLGEHPGPINSSTRAAYQAYLAKIKAGVQPSGNRGYRGYKYELALVLNGTAPIPNLSSLEQQVFQSFRQPVTPGSLPSVPQTPYNAPRPKQSTPRGRPPGKNQTPTTPGSARKCTKDHFNYLLMNPLVLDKLDGSSSDLEQFRTFVESVFYVGKGKNSRSAQHLKDASNSCSKPLAKVSAKLQRIRDIWSRGRGVISLHLFHHTTAEEAFTREACLIETIGLHLLTNVQRGHVYGEVCGWRMGKRRQLGVYLLHKAFRSYLLDAPQEIFQYDL